MENLTKKQIIIEGHLHVNNAEDLAKYIETRICSNKKDGFNFEILGIEDGYVTGIFYDEFFNIYFEKGKRCVLDVGIKDNYCYNKLQRILAMVMWNVNESSVCLSSVGTPILSYTKGQRKILEWENIDPVRRLKRLANSIYNLGEEYDNLEITFQNYNEDNIQELIEGQEFDPTMYVPIQTLEAVQTLTELELYSLIDQSDKDLDLLIDNGQEDSEVYEEVMAKLRCLLSQTEKYGVKASKDINLLYTPEQLAWGQWWAEGLDKFYKEDPVAAAAWDFLPNGYDENFRPEGTFKDYLNISNEKDDQPGNK